MGITSPVQADCPQPSLIQSPEPSPDQALPKAEAQTEFTPPVQLACPQLEPIQQAPQEASAEPPALEQALPQTGSMPPIQPDCPKPPEPIQPAPQKESAETPAPVQSTCQAQPVPLKKSRKKSTVAALVTCMVVACLFAVALVATVIVVTTRDGGGGGGNPGGESVVNGENASDGGSIAGKSGKDIFDGESVAGEEVSPGKALGPAGNSKAFSITPMGGLTVSAKANAMDRDRTITAKFLDMESRPDIVERTEAHGGFPLLLFEVDAGMRDDEELPGTLDMEIDLKTTGIAESLRGDLSVFRIADNGAAVQLASTVKGDKLTFSTKHNDVFTLIAGGIILGSGYITHALPMKIAQEDKWEGTGFPFGKNTKAAVPDAKPVCTNIAFLVVGGSYRLYWVAPDGSDWEKAVIETTRLWHEVQKLLKDTHFPSVKNTAELNAKKAEYIARVAEEDCLGPQCVQSRIHVIHEYANHRKSTFGSRSWVISQMPDDIAIVYGALAKADQYTKSRYRTRPDITDVICVYASSGGDYALFRRGGNKNVIDPYITVYMEEMQPYRERIRGLPIKQTDIDNMYVTMAHEVFHACQYAYGFSDNSNIPYNEALAAVFERQVVKAYSDDPPVKGFNGQKIDWPGGSDKYILLAHPLDSPPESDLGHYGYTFGRFLWHMLEKQGVKDAGDLKKFMENYEKKGFVDALIDIAGGKKKLQDAWIVFCVDNVGSFAKVPDKLDTPVGGERPFRWIGNQSALSPIRSHTFLTAKVREMALEDAVTPVEIEIFDVSEDKIWVGDVGAGVGIRKGKAQITPSGNTLKLLELTLERGLTVTMEGYHLSQEGRKIVRIDEPTSVTHVIRPGESAKHTFTALAEPHDDSYIFVWDFKDGTKSDPVKGRLYNRTTTASTITHEYKAAGDFHPTVTLYKTGNPNPLATATAHVEVTVEPEEAPVPTITGSYHFSHVTGNLEGVNKDGSFKPEFHVTPYSKGKGRSLIFDINRDVKLDNRFYFEAEYVHNKFEQEKGFFPEKTRLEKIKLDYRNTVGLCVVGTSVNVKLYRSMSGDDQDGQYLGGFTATVPGLGESWDSTAVTIIELTR